MKRKRRRALLPLVRSQLHLLRGEGSKLLITASEKTSLWYVFCWKVPINEAAMMLFPFDLPSIPSLSFLPSREQWGPGSWRLPQASRRLGRGQPSEGSRAGCEIWRGEIRQRQRKEAHSQEPRENLQLLWRRWDRLKALVFCAALLFSGFISKMKEVGNDFLRILLQEASRHIFWLYSSLCLLSPFCLSPFPFNPWKVLLKSTMGPCRMFAGVQQRPLYSSCPTRPSLSLCRPGRELGKAAATAFCEHPADLPSLLTSGVSLASSISSPISSPSNSLVLATTDSGQEKDACMCKAQERLTIRSGYKCWTFCIPTSFHKQN